MTRKDNFGAEDAVLRTDNMSRRGKVMKGESGKRLRQRAKTIIGAYNATTSKELSLMAMNRLHHELQMHQIELEQQNDELLRTHDELDESHRRYFELFDMAPVGYLTLNKLGNVLEANLTIATLLGVARPALINKPFTKYVLPEELDIYYLERSKISGSLLSWQWEMRLARQDGSFFWAELKMTQMRSDERWVVVTDISQRRQIEMLLHQQSQKDINKYAEQYQAVLATGLFGFWLLDMTGKMMDVNDTYCRMSGYSREELLQLYITDLDAAESTEETARHLEELIADGVASFESEHKTKEGWVYSVEISTVFLRSQNHIVTLIRDISDRKIAEAELQLSESRYQAIVEDQTDLICRYRPDGRLTFVNEAYLRCFKKKRNQLINHNYIPHIPEPDLTIVLEQLKEITSDRPIVNVEHQVIMSDGTLRWQHWIHRGVYSSEASVIEYQAVGRDITDRKTAESALKESRGRLKAYMDNSIDVIFTLNTEGEFQFVSRAWERHFGYSLKKVLGRNFSLFVHPDDISPCAEYLMQIMNGCQNITSPPYRVKRFDGSWCYFVANGSRYLDANNEWQFIGVAHDISGQMETEEQLRKAKAAADAASNAKTAFLATMSHEIRTPLSALLGSIELLSESELVPQQQVYLKNCHSAAQMLLQVINDVLDFSKIEAGKLELNKESFSVISMVRGIVKIFAGSAVDKGVALTLKSAGDLPAHISSDQHRLSQIITNLLSNAIKFTDHGTISLEITWEQPPFDTHKDSVVLVIAVRDTGIGIPPEKQETIFDSFTQLENFSDRRHAGTGLGLAICRRLALMMGGTITLSSMPGQGSVFTLSLPVAVSRPIRQATAWCAETIPAVPRKILLADDDELGRSVTAAMLQRRGHSVTAVENGTSLLEALQWQQFDIILSDISMPDMDGIEVLRIIRSGDQTGIDAAVPIIAMTAHAFSEDRIRFLSCGFNGYAAKPLDFEELLQQIDQLCV